MKHRIEVCTFLVIVIVFTARPVVWSQAAGGRCQIVTGGNGFGSCNVPGAACGANPNLQGTCVTGLRTGSPFGCNCVDSSGGIIPSGQPGTSVSVATPGTVLASGKVMIKVLNTGSLPAQGISAFVVSTEGILTVGTFPKLATGQTAEQDFTLPSSGPVVAGIFSPHSLRGLAPDVATLNADGSLLNISGDQWLKTSKAIYYNPENFLDLSSLAPASGKAFTSPLASAGPNVQVIVYNSSPNDQSYTVKEINDSGAVVATGNLTVPHGKMGGTSISALPDFHLEIDGNGGIPLVVVNQTQQVPYHALATGGVL